MVHKQHSTYRQHFEQAGEQQNNSATLTNDQPEERQGAVDGVLPRQDVQQGIVAIPVVTIQQSILVSGVAVIVSLLVYNRHR